MLVDVQLQQYIYVYMCIRKHDGNKAVSASVTSTDPVHLFRRFCLLSSCLAGH